MSEQPEHTETTRQATAPHKPYWLYQLAAWVVILAGITFIASTVFFTGAYVSRSGEHGHHHCHHSMMGHKGHMNRGHDGTSGQEQQPGPAELPSNTQAPTPGR